MEGVVALHPGVQEVAPQAAGAPRTSSISRSADLETRLARYGAASRTSQPFFNNHDATAVDERAPFGGFNASGIGRELGRQGRHEFTETHVMAVPSDG